MEEPFLVGIGLRVPPLGTTATTNQLKFLGYSLYGQPPAVPEVPNILQPGPDGLVDFEYLLLLEKISDPVFTIERCR